VLFFNACMADSPMPGVPDACVEADFDASGVIDSNDFGPIAQCFGQAPGPSCCSFLEPAPVPIGPGVGALTTLILGFAGLMRLRSQARARARDRG
jgi:hypothetical protein